MDAIAHTLTVTWKEIQLILKDRGALALFFVLPLLLGLMMGGTNLMGSSGEQATILLNVCLVNEDTGGFGQEVARAIADIKELKIESPASVAAAEERVARGEVAAAILIPADFSRKIESHTAAAIDVVVDPGQPESASIVTGIMNQVVSEVTIWGEVQYGIRTLLNQSGAPAGASAEQAGAVEAQTLGVIMTTLNEMRQTPAIAVDNENLVGAKVQGGIALFFALLFPGFTVMFIFLNVSWSASSLLRERETGALRRLLASPLPRGAIIAGKMVAFMLLSCLQVVVLFTVARILFKMPLGQSPIALVVLTLVVALAATALGMMVAALAKSASQAGNIGLLLGFVLAGLGGCIPLSKTPITRAGGLLGMLANLTPQGHAVDAYYRLFAEKATFVEIVPQIGLLLALGVICFLVARWRFRFEQ